MRAADGFHVEWVDDEAVVLDPASGTLHYLNPPAALAYALIIEVGVEQARDKVRETFGSPTVDGDWDELIEGMREKGLLLDD